MLLLGGTDYFQLNPAGLHFYSRPPALCLPVLHYAPVAALYAMQAIVQMARGADKDGRRTIGVLTKADTIELGTHDNWLKVLKGDTYALKLGYFCVVNPSQVRALG